MPWSVEEIRENLQRVACDPAADIAEGALWIAAEQYPELRLDTYRDYLSRLADHVISEPATDSDPRPPLAVTLFDHEGFSGNAEEYYDPRNSFLNEVIDRKLGIPITLSVVYLSVARTQGRRATGLNTPGHFLVVDGDTVLDPFHKGQVVERSALEAQVERAGSRDPSADLDRLLAQRPDNRSILTRILVNLRTNHLREHDVDRALTVVDRLVSIDSENPMWLRDRGALFQKLDCPRAAAADLRAYLDRAPNDPEADVIRKVIDRLTRELPPLQ